MEPLFEDFILNLQELHDEAQRLLAGLPQPALDWTPAVEINSLAVLAVHLCGAERYWVGEVVGGEPFVRDRPAEFRAQGLTADELTRGLEYSLTNVRGVLEKLTSADLERLHLTRDGRQVRAGWVLGHVLKHTAIHLGHMQLMRQWWEEQQGS
jgi:phage terminase large subunit-like protein